jgi:NAD-dependent deacetylase sirtuin 2
MGGALPTPVRLPTEEEEEVLGFDCSVEAISRYIESGRANNLVFMVGAGVSVSAGIPDFRTPGTGLYDNLQKYKLPRPEAIFDIEFFRENPYPFYDLARDLLPSNFKPTPAHLFIRACADKGILKRCYTQNIDTLERRAGIPPELLVEAHGSFGSAHCTKCNTQYSQEFFSDELLMGRSWKGGGGGVDARPCVKCTEQGCDGFVKPDIVFFGENLPGRYFDLRDEDLNACDLLVVMGTSLAVTPFANTLHLCNPKSPRLLINLERVGQIDNFSNGNGFLFDRRDNWRDVEMLGPCDEAVRVLCERIGWLEDLEILGKQFDAGFSFSSSDNDNGNGNDNLVLLEEMRSNLKRNYRKTGDEADEDDEDDKGNNPPELDFSLDMDLNDSQLSPVLVAMSCSPPKN